MIARSFTSAAGTAVTTFLVAGVATIELLGAGEAPGIGIIGVFVGIVAGRMSGGLVSHYADRLTGVAASILIAYATFGVAIVAIPGMSYVNVPYADAIFTFPVHVGVSLLAAVTVAMLAGCGRFSERTPPT